MCAPQQPREKQPKLNVSLHLCSAQTEAAPHYLWRRAEQQKQEGGGQDKPRQGSAASGASGTVRVTRVTRILGLVDHRLEPISQYMSLPSSGL